MKKLLLTGLIALIGTASCSAFDTGSPKGARKLCTSHCDSCDTNKFCKFHAYEEPTPLTPPLTDIVTEITKTSLPILDDQADKIDSMLAQVQEIEACSDLDFKPYLDFVDQAYDLSMPRDAIVLYGDRLKYLYKDYEDKYKKFNDLINSIKKTYEDKDNELDAYMNDKEKIDNTTEAGTTKERLRRTLLSRKKSALRPTFSALLAAFNTEEIFESLDCLDGTIQTIIDELTEALEHSKNNPEPAATTSTS